MTACRNPFHNGAMAHTYYQFMKVLSTGLLWHVEVIKPDDFNLATTILVLKFSQLHKTLILGRL